MSKHERISRRNLIKVLTSVFGASAFYNPFGSVAHAATLLNGSHKGDVIAGAIRWDAWYKRADASVAAQNTLSSEQFYKRAPFFCSATSDFQVNCIGTPDEMSTEIDLAVKSGLKYWAFDWYGPDSSLRSAWELYQNNPNNHRLNWCGLTGLGLLGSSPFSDEKWRINIVTWAQYMQQRNYQKVLGNRPLLFILWSSDDLKAWFSNNLENVHYALGYLQLLLAKVKLGPPYVVVLDGIVGAPIARSIGADAISNYIAQHKSEYNGPYLDLDLQARDYWKRMAESGVPIVPIAQVGWDIRARTERPVPWQHATPNPNPTQYYEPPTPIELATHIGAAADFIRTHPLSCPSKVMLIYSWDECDEGGGLIPTLGDPNGAYLKAIARVLL